MIPLNKYIKKLTIKRINDINIKNIVLNIIELFLVVIISILFYLNLTVESKQVVYIPKGSTSYIVTYLDEKGYDLNTVDKVILKFIGYPQSGWIDLKSIKMKKADFLYKITTSKAALKSITLIPGETYYFFIDDVSKKLKISKKLLLKFYLEYGYKKDGNIIAQTYLLPIGMDEEELILYLMDYTNEQYKKYSTKIFGLYNKKNWFRYIVIASIIQKETASIEEMTTISSVIYNRIKKNMKLQMDGTLNYGKFSHTKVTPKQIRNDFSDYNTYKTKGIPKNPICAVDFNSIKASIFPKNTQYLYFMKAPDGKKHIFTKSYKNHKEAIRKVKKYNNNKKHKKKKKQKAQRKSLKQIETKKNILKNKSKKRNLKDLWKTIK